MAEQGLVPPYRRVIRLASGHEVTVRRDFDGRWHAQFRDIHTEGTRPHEAVAALRPRIPAVTNDAHARYGTSPMGAYAIVDGRAGYGLTVRDAYRAAWRALRLSRHDPADLLRKIALLNSQLDYANDLAVTFIHEIAENAQKNAESAKRRRARYATAIRAHRAEMTRRLRDCRRSLLDALAQRNAVASRITRMQAMVTEARAKSPELEHELRDLTTDNIEQIMERLLALAARAAEYHRRATAAEARAAELHAGQQSLLAAARAAGFEYTVSDGAMAMSEVV